MRHTVSEMIDYRKAGLTWVEIGLLVDLPATEVREKVTDYLHKEVYGESKNTKAVQS